MMYNFIYYFIYNIAKKRNPDAKDAAAVVTASLPMLQVFAILAILLKHDFFQLPKLDSITSKIFLVCLLLLFLTLFIRRLKSKFHSIMDYYDEIYEGKSIHSLQNYIKIGISFLIPVCIIIYFAS